MVLQPQPLQLAPQRRAVDAEEAGRLGLAEACPLQRLEQGGALGVVGRPGGRRARGADETGPRGRPRRRAQLRGQVLDADLLARHEAQVLDHVAQLAHVTRGENGIETTTLPDGTVVTSYDAMKGDFTWQKNVRPAYAWYDGRVAHMTLEDAYPAGAGSEASPVHLGGPVATKADLVAKIYPFKLMRGQQPVDTTTRKVLSPKLFGPGSFWATIPTADLYTPELVEQNWTSALTTGARYAGQIAETESFTGRATGAKPWDWVYTDLWLLINHEVAPASAALGCGSCHMGAAGWDWAALGYICDPLTGGASCGSRH